MNVENDDGLIAALDAEPETTATKGQGSCRGRTVGAIPATAAKDETRPPEYTMTHFWDAKPKSPKHLQAYMDRIHEETAEWVGYYFGLQRAINMNLPWARDGSASVAVNELRIMIRAEMAKVDMLIRLTHAPTCAR
jgi:hypothetical protein